MIVWVRAPISARVAGGLAKFLNSIPEIDHDGRIRYTLTQPTSASCPLVQNLQLRLQHGGDFDACWDLNNVDVDNLDPIFFDFSNRRAAQKAKFFGEWFPADLPNGNSGLTFLDENR